MASEKVSDRIQQLIRENDPRAAADLLAQAFRDKNPQLFNIALVQQANLKKLADQSAAGILSPEDLNREQAKANAALLHLSEEHARLYEGVASPVPLGLPRWVLLGIVIVLALVLIGWLVKSALSDSNYPKTFDVEVSLYEKGNEASVVSEGEVNLRLGEAEPQNRQSLDATGKATFKEVSEKYRDSTVQLLYFPANSRRFKIGPPSASKLSGQKQLIRFPIEFLPDTTVFEATLRDSKGRRVAGAQITVDGNLHSMSDANGYFKLAIPKATGSTANLIIEKNGKRLHAQDVTLSSGYHEIPIE